MTHCLIAICFHFRIHSGEKPYKCSRVDHECSKAFSTPHSLKSHLKTHEKKNHDRTKTSLADEKPKIKKEITFTASADLYPSGGSSSSEDTESMLFDNNVNMQFQVVDDNGNDIKYTMSPMTINYVPQFSSQTFIEQNTNEAIELSLANEVEMGAPWVDISVLANKSVIPSSPVTSSCVALSTNVPTYVNLPTYQVSSDVGSYFTGVQTGAEDQAMKELNELLMTNGYDSEGKTLKSITADAGICQCSNCKCDPQGNGCAGGCGPQNPCKTSKPLKKDSSTQMEFDTNKLIEEIDSLNVDTTKPQAAASSCDCKDTKDAVDKGCCVVICLKTLETVNADKEHGCGGDKAQKVSIANNENEALPAFAM